MILSKRFGWSLVMIAGLVFWYGVVRLMIYVLGQPAVVEALIEWTLILIAAGVGAYLADYAHQKAEREREEDESR